MIGLVKSYDPGAIRGFGFGCRQRSRWNWKCHGTLLAMTCFQVSEAG
jgi:hypothetical protein